MNKNIVREKRIFMEGYELALKDYSPDIFFKKGYQFGVEICNDNIIKTLDEYLQELQTERENGKITIGYWQIKSLIENLKRKIKNNDFRGITKMEED